MVPKSRQHVSSTTFFYNGYKMCDEITKFLIRDFGTKPSSKDLNTFTHMAKMSKEDAKTFTEMTKKYGIDVESSYPLWLLEEYRRRILTSCADFLKYLTDANTIYPNTMFEFNLKREEQWKAIGECYYMLQTLQQALRIFHPDTDKYMPYVDMIIDEVKLLRNWKTATNKQRRIIEKRDAENVIKTLKDNNILCTDRNIVTFFSKTYTESYRSTIPEPNKDPNKNKLSNSEKRRITTLAEDIAISEARIITPMYISTQRPIVKPLEFNTYTSVSDSKKPIISPLFFFDVQTPMQNYISPATGLS